MPEHTEDVAKLCVIPRGIAGGGGDGAAVLGSVVQGGSKFADIMNILI